MVFFPSIIFKGKKKKKPKLMVLALNWEQSRNVLIHFTSVFKTLNLYLTLHVYLTWK